MNASPSPETVRIFTTRLNGRNFDEALDKFHQFKMPLEYPFLAELVGGVGGSTTGVNDVVALLRVLERRRVGHQPHVNDEETISISNLRPIITSNSASSSQVVGREGRGVPRAVQNAFDIVQLALHDDEQQMDEEVNASSHVYRYRWYASSGG